jgi:hypothetical protein
VEYIAEIIVETKVEASLIGDKIVVGW